jgi:hypothetical protein
VSIYYFLAHTVSQFFIVNIHQWHFIIQRIGKLKIAQSTKNSCQIRVIKACRCLGALPMKKCGIRTGNTILRGRFSTVNLQPYWALPFSKCSLIQVLAGLAPSIQKSRILIESPSQKNDVGMAPILLIFIYLQMYFLLVNPPCKICWQKMLREIPTLPKQRLIRFPKELCISKVLKDLF